MHQKNQLCAGETVHGLIQQCRVKDDQLSFNLKCQCMQLTCYLISVNWCQKNKRVFFTIGQVLPSQLEQD